MYNKQNLIDAVHAENGGSRANAERVVDKVLYEIKNAVNRKDKVSLAGFGILTIKQVKGRTGRNPRTGEAVQVEPHNKIKFTPAKSFKSLVNE